MKNQKSPIVNPQSLISKVGVIGAGTMGSGIAQVAATAGCQVKLFDVNQEQLDKAEAALEKIMNRLI
jgi:3-hydroxybutyryl-CoA dehydrogenase